jgi:hypothetical protein
MMEQVTITIESPERAKPLLRAAIRNQVKLLEHGIERTRARLTAFEKQYGVKSDEFLRRFQSGEMAETLELIDWRMEIEAMRLLQGEYHILNGALVD